MISIFLQVSKRYRQAVRFCFILGRYFTALYCLRSNKNATYLSKNAAYQYPYSFFHRKMLYKYQRETAVFKMTNIAGQYRKIKFKNVIRPNQIIDLVLEKTTKGIMYTYKDEEKTYSSGVLPIVKLERTD